MTEKEKMLSGKLYYSFLDGLFEERQHAKDLVFEFNSLSPKEVEKRNEILKELLGKTGKNFFFEPPFRCDYGYNIEIGENFYSNHNLVILDGNKVTFGDNVEIGAEGVVNKDIQSNVLAVGNLSRV